MPIAPNVLIMDIEGGEAQIPPDHFTLFNKIIIETHRKLIGDEPIDRIFQHLKGCGYANRGNIGGSFAFVADG